MNNCNKTRPHRNAPELQDFIKSKETTREIANRYEISPSTLTARAKKVGLPLRKRGRWQLSEPTSQQKKILQLVQTRTYQEVGERFGMSKQRVSQLVRRWTTWKAANSSSRRGIRRQKARVVSFRVNDAAYQDLQKLLKFVWFKRLRSTDEAAREIVYKYLADVFSESRFSMSKSVVNHVKTSEAV